MDIPALSMAMGQASLAQSASVSVMKMAMDTAKANAASMTEMLNQNKVMEQSVQPHLGGHIDVRL